MPISRDGSLTQGLPNTLRTSLILEGHWKNPVCVPDIKSAFVTQREDPLLDVITVLFRTWLQADRNASTLTVKTFISDEVELPCVLKAT